MKDYYKELARMIMKVGMSENCSLGWQAGDQGKSMVQFQSKDKPTVLMKSQDILLENFLLLGAYPHY